MVEETLKWMIIALIVGVIFGFIVGASPDPMMIVRNPGVAIDNAMGALGRL